MRKSKGFTLVELLVIIAIIAVIAGVAIPLLINMQKSATDSNLENTVTQIELAVEQYKSSGSKTATGFNTLLDEDDGLFISEQTLFLEKAGKGAYPGQQIQSSDIVDETAVFNDVVYSLIRKEAITAVKAFTDIRVIDEEENPEDNYYIDADLSEGTAIVYNYLTGKVSLEKISDMQALLGGSDAAVDTRTYFVYLTRPFQDSSNTGGGGAVKPNNPVDDEEFKGDFYLQLVDWVTGMPISNGEVGLYNGIETREYKTDANGFIILSGSLAYGEYSISAEAPGYIKYFNDIYKEQHDNANLLVTKDGYVGDSVLNIYKIRLINSTMGTMSFIKMERTFNKVSEVWDTVEQQIKEGTITIKFEPDTSDLSAAKTEESVVYTADLSENEGIVKLYDTTGETVKNLKIGNYIMTVDLEADKKYRTLTKKVSVSVYGIDDRPDAQYAGLTTFYNYEQELYTETTEIKGKITSNMDLNYQPLENIEVYGFWDFSTSGTKEFRTYVELWQNNVKKYSAEINTDGTYDIEGIADGTYSVFVRNTYCEKFQPSKIAYVLRAEGITSNLDMVVAESDYTEVDVTFTLKFPDGSPITTDFKVEKDGVTGITNPVVSDVLKGGTATFKLKPGVYRFTYAKPYAKTESDWYSTVVVTDKGKVVNAIYQQVNTTVNISTLYEGVSREAPDKTGQEVILTCIDVGNKAPSVKVTVDNKGSGIASVKPGNYRYEVRFAEHYVDISGTIALFDKTQSWLTPITKNLSIQAKCSTDLSKHSALIYESVTAKTHLQHCTLCGYKTPSVSCTFNGIKELPTDANATSSHYTYCSVCKINKELQAHKFEGAYKAVGGITGINTGTHYRKCTECEAYGLNGVKDKTESCSLSVTNIGTNTHTFTCSKCSNSKAINHDYTGEYRVVTAATKSVNGTHNRKCLYCESYGIGNTKDKVENCTIVTSSTNASQHTRICNVCNKNSYTGVHEWGNYLIVEKKTETNSGKHNRQCTICDYYEASAQCSHVEDKSAVTTSTHTYKCTTCGNKVQIYHNFSGAYEAVTDGTVAKASHRRKCTGCSYYGTGSGKDSQVGQGEYCTFNDTPVSVNGTQHKYTCTVCKINTSTVNHTWGSYTIVTNKTKKDDGTHKRVCTACGQEEAVSNCDGVLDSTLTTDTQHVYKCSKCGNTFKENHTWVTTGTTATTVTQKCSVCGKVSTKANHPPTTPTIIPIPDTDTHTIKKGRNFTLRATATDPDGDEVSFEWKNRLAETSNAYPVGDTTVYCRAKDSNGAYSDWASYKFTVKDAAPVTLKVITNNATKFDIHGYVEKTGTDLKTTYNNGGYTSRIMVREADSANYSNLASLTGTIMGNSGTFAALDYTRKVEYDDVLNYVKISYTVTNTSTTTKKVSISCDSDIQINSEDDAGITATNKGFKMSDGTYDFYVNIKNMQGVTNADHLWYGHYSDRTKNLWGDSIMHSNIAKGSVDTGFVVSWFDRTIAPGETKTYSFIINIE